MSSYKRLLSYLAPHKGVLLGAFAFMGLTSLFEAAPITLVIPLVDRIMADQLIQLPQYAEVPVWVADLVAKINAAPRLWVLNTLIIAALAAGLIRALSEFAYTYFMSDASQRVIRDIRARLYDKLITLPLGYYSSARTGTLVSRVTHDTGIVRDAISEGLKDLLFQPIQFVSFLIVLLGVRHVFAIPWSFIGIIVIVMPIIIYPVIQLGKRLKKISRQSQENMADIHTSIFESLSGIRVVQAFGAEDYEKAKLHRHNQNYYLTMMRSIARTTLIRPITAVVIAVCAGVIASLGGKAIIDGGMSPGALLAFLAALFSLFRPFKRLSRLHSINQTALAAAERIYEVLDAKEHLIEDPDPVYVGPLKRTIEFQGVHFAYEPGKPILKGIDLTIHTGEVVAIVGPSGTGKTTLVNLVPRFYDPFRGEVRMDGVPLKKITIKSLRNQIGIVTQETILFNDTVAANIAYGRTNAPQAAIEHAARTANAHDFIKNLPNGYQTLVGDRGFRLSGGERQRIAIARAVYKNPPILILDEATSALDAESEKLVQEALENLMKGRTVLVIAHRLSTVKGASRIIVLEDGRVREQGNHDHLLQQGGLYKKIYELQFR